MRLNLGSNRCCDINIFFHQTEPVALLIRFIPRRSSYFYLSSAAMGSHVPSFVRADLSLPTKLPGELQQNRGLNSVRTVPELVDFNAFHNADNVFCYQACKDDSGKARLVSITHLEFRDAARRCQEWLKSSINNLQLPVLQENGVISRNTPVALFMESDIGLFVHIVALLGLGVPVLLLSARLSPLAIGNLTKTTHCSAILASPRLARSCEAAVQPGNSGGSPPAVIYERQPYEVFLSQRKESPAPSSETTVCHANYHADEKDRNAIILHSSGTTGLPKAIYQSQEYVLGYAANHCLSPEEANGVNVSTLPLFHVSWSRSLVRLENDSSLKAQLGIRAIGAVPLPQHRAPALSARQFHLIRKHHC